MNKYFELRGDIDRRTASILTLVGAAVILCIWEVIVSASLIPRALWPSPWSVITSVREMIADDRLAYNLLYSLRLNVYGYLEAVVVSVPVGFVLGLYPLTRGMFKGITNAMRFLPLAALTGAFIAWFGIDDMMKVQFLAFSIIVYLVPVTVQLVESVDDVYIQTAKTLGATPWQTIRDVFIPAVMSQLFDYIRVIVATSWTYIIVVEMINRNAGIGALISVVARQNRIDKVFGGVLVILLVGVLQDALFMYMDRIFFPHKYASKERP